MASGRGWRGATGGKGRQVGVIKNGNYFIRIGPYPPVRGPTRSHHGLGYHRQRGVHRSDNRLLDFLPLQTIIRA